MTMVKLVYQPLELVEVLGLSRSSVYTGLRNGTIPCIRVSKRILIPKKMLDEWLSKRGQKVEAVAKS